MEPHDHNFEAIVNFKECCNEKNKLYVYKIRNRRGNPDQPSFVFKSSEAKMKLAVPMNNEKDHFLSKEFCFFDGKHNRCRGFVTLTAIVYHPLLRKQIPLAIMEAEKETTENVELFWKLFKASNGSCKSFNPIGWCTDMAGANLAGLVNVFGVDAKKRIKSCEFHFKDLRNKKAQRLDIDSAKEFKTLCDELLRSTTVAVYEAAKRQLDTFIAADLDREFLTSWISWWHERRGFIFHAFAPTNAPTMNQAEVVHAGWANRDRPNMSLLDACHADVRDSLLLEMELQGLQSGSTTKGRDPTFAGHTGERHGREVGKEMFAADQADSSDGLCIDPKSSHRPKTQRKNSKKDKTSYGKQCC